MKEQRKNIQKFTLLSDDMKMNESTSISQPVSTTSGEEGFEEPPVDKKDESTPSTKVRTTQISSRSKTNQLTSTKSEKSSGSSLLKKRNRGLKQDAVIVPRRQKSLLPPRPSSRTSTSNKIVLAVAPDFYKPASKGSKINTTNVKNQGLINHSVPEPESAESIEHLSQALSNVEANRDRLFGGEPEPKTKKNVRRKRHPKPDDNSCKHVYWWIGTNEDEEPPMPTSTVARPPLSPPSAVQQIFSGDSNTELEKTLHLGQRRTTYKLRDDDTSTKIFGTPEVKQPNIKIRPGDSSHDRLFGPELEGGIPLAYRSSTSNGRLVSQEATKERLFGEKSSSNLRPTTKLFPAKLAHENIFAPPEPPTLEVKNSSKVSINRNPIIGEAVQPRTRRDSGIPSSNPITGEGYWPMKRDIHAVTCRI